MVNAIQTFTLQPYYTKRQPVAQPLPHSFPMVYIHFLLHSSLLIYIQPFAYLLLKASYILYSLTVRQCEGLTVWHLTLRKCVNVKIWQCDKVTRWQCGSVTVWQYDSGTMLSKSQFVRVSVRVSVCLCLHFWGTVSMSFCPHFLKSVDRTEQGAWIGLRSKNVKQS